jgi:hypothetical protein
MGLHASPTELSRAPYGGRTAGECRYRAVLGIQCRRIGAGPKRGGSSRGLWASSCDADSAGTEDLYDPAGDSL